MKPTYELGQAIFYIEENRICSAVVFSRLTIENLHDNWASNKEQEGLFTPFGKQGVYYSTCHGTYHADEVYGSRESLLMTNGG